MTFDALGKILELASQALTLLAVAVGAAWAAWRFLIRREHSWNLQLGLDIDQIPITNGLALLSIKVTLKNVGNIRVVPGSSGCRISVRQVNHDLAHGRIVSWEDATPVVDNVDALRHYKEGGAYPNYEIEPKCEYQEIENVPVQTGFVYMVKAKFWWKKDSDSIETDAVIGVPRGNQGR